MLHDPGGKSRFPLLPGCRGDASFRGEHDEHRIWLDRCWGEVNNCTPFAVWICHNPSTAGREEDDPLVRKVIGFTQRMGLQRFVLLNVATYRCTDPGALPLELPLRWEENMATIRWMVQTKDCPVIAAWGVPHPRLASFATQTLAVIRRRPCVVLCLGTTKDGHPKHPGRISYDTPLVPMP